MLCCQQQPVSSNLTKLRIFSPDMKKEPADVSIRAWQSNGVLRERYSYTSGAVEPIAKHSHIEYQFGLSFNCEGQYYYRGVYNSIPTCSLSIIHSGEIHAPSDRTYLEASADFEMMHISPECLRQTASEMAEKSASLPFFSTAFLTDRTLNHLFLAITNPEKFRLQQDVALLQFLSYLIKNHASNSPTLSPLKSTHEAIKLAREYLHAHYSNDISLSELAAIAGLSKFHFCRIFQKELGVSASVYQTQLRIAHAKKLLIQGIEIAKVAAITGFYDQSHFSWHFKRQVGVTPRKYAKKQQ
jgi:AraC-like DNA-binding protein